ncbi:MAG: PKD domain-containing protein [Bacteroidota bacterium]
MKLLSPILLLTLLAHISIAQDNSSPTVSAVGGQQVFCLTDNTFELSVEINLNGFTGSIERYEIKWGDNSSPTVVPFSPNVPIQTHTFDFEDFFGSCAASREFTIRLDAYLTDGGTPLNSAFFPTFLNPPQAVFESSRSTICVGEEVCFDDDSCPRDGLRIVSWDYGDGSSGIESCHTYTEVGIYRVELAVENDCGIDRTINTIQVIEPAVASAEPTAGIVADGGSDPYLVCLEENGTTVFVNGSNSQNASFFEWTANTNRGIRWLSSQRNRQDTLLFTEAGTYEITLEVDNACGNPNETTIQFEVIEAVSLLINAQADVCEALSYTPDPLIPEATYRINGMEQSTFPVDLLPGDYVVEATLSNECGPQTVRDNFTISTNRNVAIFTPDTTLCSASDTLFIQLDGADSLDNCLANGDPLINCAFIPAEATETTYTIQVEGTCVVSESITINVIQTSQLTLDVPQTSFCVEDEPVVIMPSTGGGEFIGRGIDSTGTYDPSRAGVGMDTITYLVEFEAGIGESCPASTSTFVEVFPTIAGDFQAIECDGNSVTFDTLNMEGVFTNIRYDFGDGQSSTQISPTHTYAQSGLYVVSMSIERNGGCSFTKTDSITVEPPPIASFQPISEPRGCSVLEVEIQDQSQGNNLSYFWDFGNGQSDSTATPPNVFYEAIGQDTTYTITLQVANGCSVERTSQQIFVKAGPNPFFAIDKDQHCSGEAVAFQSVVANVSDNNDFWRWDFGDGTSFDEKFPPPHIYTSNRQDTFLVSLTVGNDCDTTTFTRAVVVIPSDVTAFMNVQQTLACAEQQLRFINESGVPNAEFFFSDGITLRGDTVLHSFQTDTAQAFTVTMRVFGCGFDDTTQTINVIPIPDLAFDAPDEICAGEVFEVTTTSNVAGISIAFGDGTTVGRNRATHVYQESGDYTIRVTATSAQTSGCVTFLSQPITVKASPVAGFTYAPDILCAQNTISIQDTSLGDIIARTWQLGDGNVRATQSNLDYTYTQAGNYELQLNVENNLGCQDSTTQTLNVQALPELDIGYTIPDPCSYQVDFQNNTSANAFTWQFGDNSMRSDETLPQHTYTNFGDYTASLVAELNGCRDSTTVLVQLEELPTFAIAFVQDQKCATSTVDFNASNSSSVETYQWDFGDGTTSFEAIQVHTYTSPGNYQVQLSITGAACTLDSTFTVFVGDTLLASVANLTNVACFGEATGTSEIQISSGNAPYSFTWSNDVNTNPNEGLVAGDYQVTITDSLACELVLSTTIEQPIAALQNTLVRLQAVSCYEFTDGAFEVAALGGTAPYRYRWADGNTARSRANLGAGNYELRIIDANECVLETAVELPQPAPIQIDILAEEICYEEVGSFIVNVSGGTPPYLISRDTNFEELTDFYDNLPAGLYDIFVQDNKGCPANATAELVQRPDWNFFFPRDTHYILKGDSARLEAFISIADFELNWFPDDRRTIVNDRTAWVRPLRSTNYNVVATDEFGCIKSAPVVVFVKDTVAVYIPNAFTPASSKGAGNGVNDYFTAYSDFPAAIQIKQMVIANKWGQILFDKTNLPLNIEESAWDGTYNGEPQSPDEYAYRIVIEYIDGEETFKGIVRLIR